MIDPRSRSTATRTALASLVASVGLAGVCLIGTSLAPHPAWGQQLVSSRRSALQVPPQSPVPAVNLTAEEPGAKGPTPARLPPIQADASPDNGSPPSDAPFGDPEGFDARDAFGRPTSVKGYGLKRRLQDCYWGYPEEFCERPFGISNRAALDAMIGNGLGDYLILYQFDFHDGSQAAASQLNYAGIVRLQRIVRMLRGQTRPSVVVVEDVPGETKLALARQDEVAAQLARMGIGERSATVMLGRPRRGLIGDEGVVNYHNMINLSSSQGRSLGAATSNSAAGGIGVGTTGGNGSQQTNSGSQSR